MINESQSFNTKIRKFYLQRTYENEMNNFKLGVTINLLVNSIISQTLILK